ncbi:DinB family protein [Zhihengliuella halotolerans]|uniref:DinB family protein n=1 Tax=Zhihengliuella halotolerans TaxID=370736 RepID=A0A4Q8AD88_9MICC|nr:DinB family protein [Zhihengliuella halotolerans]RZU62192.1 DinB family protein [Zhihengliuella halotolerans]
MSTREENTAENAGWVPDSKDWTWVLAETCPECGADVSAMSPQDVAAAIRDCLPAWRELLIDTSDDDAALRTRPEPNTWSPLEYAAHVRDVFRIMHYRLDLMLREDVPTFPDWDQDATAREDRYLEQDPRTVAIQLASAGRGLADAFDSVLARDIGRRGLRSNGSEFTVETLSRYAWHDIAHHLHDLELA